MTIENTIKKYIDSENLVYIERKDFEEWAVECMPKAVAGDCVIVSNTVDFKHNGYRVFLICDISDFIIDETTVFREKIYKKVPQNENEMPDFSSCKTLADIFEVLKNNDILVSVDAEKDDDCIYLTGKIISTENGVLTLRCYDDLARWETRNTRLDMDYINSITFYDRNSLVMKKYLREI
jgi:hypothetical protein